MNKTDLVKVANRDSGRVGYKIDELGVMRQFAPRETKEVTFEELERLSFLPGGDVMLKNYLIVKNPEAIKQLGIDVEPEYYYTEKEIKDILVNGTMDQFLDCLDFAPDGVLDLLKKILNMMEIQREKKKQVERQREERQSRLRMLQSQSAARNQSIKLLQKTSNLLEV